MKCGISPDRVEEESMNTLCLELNDIVKKEKKTSSSKRKSKEEDISFSSSKRKSDEEKKKISSKQKKEEKISPKLSPTRDIRNKGEKIHSLIQTLSHDEKEKKINYDLAYKDYVSLSQKNIEYIITQLTIKHREARKKGESLEDIDSQIEELQQKVEENNKKRDDHKNRVDVLENELVQIKEDRKKAENDLHSLLADEQTKEKANTYDLVSQINSSIDRRVEDYKRASKLFSPYDMRTCRSQISSSLLDRKTYLGVGGYSIVFAETISSLKLPVAVREGIASITDIKNLFYQIFGLLLSNRFIEEGISPNFSLTYFTSICREEEEKKRVKPYLYRIGKTGEYFLTISERAHTDLQQIGKDLTEGEFKSILIQGLVSILILQLYDTVHNDLYARNILITFIDPTVKFTYKYGSFHYLCETAGILVKISDFDLLTTTNVMIEKDSHNRFQPTIPYSRSNLDIYDIKQLNVYYMKRDLFSFLLSLFFSPIRKEDKKFVNGLISKLESVGNNSVDVTDFILACLEDFEVRKRENTNFWIVNIGSINKEFESYKRRIYEVYYNRPVEFPKTDVCTTIETLMKQRCKLVKAKKEYYDSFFPYKKPFLSSLLRENTDSCLEGRIYLIVSTPQPSEKIREIELKIEEIKNKYSSTIRQATALVFGSDESNKLYQEAGRIENKLDKLRKKLDEEKKRESEEIRELKSKIEKLRERSSPSRKSGIESQIEILKKQLGKRDQEYAWGSIIESLTSKEHLPGKCEGRNRRLVMIRIIFGTFDPKAQTDQTIVDIEANKSLETHANVLLIDGKKRTLELFEPGGSYASWTDVVTDTLESYFHNHKLYKDYKFFSPVITCPYVSMQGIVRDSMCANWSTLIGFVVSSCPDADSGGLIKELVGLGKEKLIELMEKWICFMWSFITERGIIELHDRMSNLSPGDMVEAQEMFDFGELDNLRLYLDRKRV